MIILLCVALVLLFLYDPIFIGAILKLAFMTASVLFIIAVIGFTIGVFLP